MKKKCPKCGCAYMQKRPSEPDTAWVCANCGDPVSFDKLNLIQTRGGLCACGCGCIAHDAHHALIPNLKRFAEYVNDPRNIALVNHDQHISRKFDNQKWRRIFYLQNVQRYGQAAMNEWVESLPEKLKHRLDFLR